MFAVGAILLTGVLVSAIFGYWAKAHSENYQVGEQSDEQTAKIALADWNDELADPDLDFSDFLEQMPDYLGDMDKPRLDEAFKAMQKKDFSKEEKEVASALFHSLSQDELKPLPELEELAKKNPQVRYAQQALGIVYYQMNDYFSAARAYEKEGMFPEADTARESAVELYDQLGRISDLERLSALPDFEKAFTERIRLDMAAERKDWKNFWKHLLPAQYESVRPEIILMALLSGMVWLTISCRLLQLETLRSTGFLICLAAFCLGVASTWPTVFVYTWMEKTWGFTESGDFFNNSVFFIFGVGLNEESLKLIFFCPLIPILLKRDNQLEILLAAGCVGLGFAAEENISYLNNYGTDTMASRFVTANFLHISATALAGLALCRAISDPHGHLSEFVRWFGGIVLIHAAYDILLGEVPGMGDTQVVAMACYIYLCYKFFGQTHALRVRHYQVIGLNFIFLTGLAIVLSLVMIDLSSTYGFQRGLSMIVIQVAGVVIVCYLFVREFSKDGQW